MQCANKIWRGWREEERMKGEMRILIKVEKSNLEQFET